MSTTSIKATPHQTPIKAQKMGARLPLCLGLSSSVLYPRNRAMGYGTWFHGGDGTSGFRYRSISKLQCRGSFMMVDKACRARGPYQLGVGLGGKLTTQETEAAMLQYEYLRHAAEMRSIVRVNYFCTAVVHGSCLTLARHIG